jgi:hypothetical protein
MLEMNGLGQDVKRALRIFRRSPAFASVVVLTLALGSGANTAIFTLLDQVMLRALPVERPDRLVVLHAPGPSPGWSMSQSDTAKPLSQPMLDGLRDRTRAFSGAFGRYRTPIHLSVGGETESVNGDMVSGEFFEVLGLRAAHGRLFTRDDDRTPSGHPVVVLGHAFFERRFGGDTSVVGRVVGVNRHPMTVIGVAPPGFNGIEVGAAVDVYVPVAMQQEVQPTDVRHAARLLLRNRRFTAAAAGAIALGIGADVTFFSLVDAVLRRPLPYREPERLVALSEWHPQRSRYGKVSGANLQEWTSRATAFEDLGCYFDHGYTVTGSTQPETLLGWRFSGNLFSLLGARALIGRTLVPDDARPGRDDVVVISDGLWHRRFAASPAAVGQTLALDGRLHTIVGVMPREFAHPGPRGTSGRRSSWRRSRSPTASTIPCVWSAASARGSLPSSPAARSPTSPRSSPASSRRGTRASRPTSVRSATSTAATFGPCSGCSRAPSSSCS